MIIPYTDETQHCVMDESARPYEDNEKKDWAYSRRWKVFPKSFAWKGKLIDNQKEKELYYVAVNDEKQTGHGNWFWCDSISCNRWKIVVVFHAM